MSADDPQLPVRREKRTPRPLRTPRLRLLLAALGWLLFAAFPSIQPAQTPAPSQALASPRNQADAQSGAEPRCTIAGKREISIACDYSPAPAGSAAHDGDPLIALNHAELSFKTKGDHWVKLALTFTRLNDSPLAESRLVYIEIDDENGRNFIRRPLPAVNLAGLAVGQPVRFEQWLLFPALQPGHYRIKLWIPSNDPALKFKAAHNLLIGSVGVPDPKSGLNMIAAFTVSN